MEKKWDTRYFGIGIGINKFFGLMLVVYKQDNESLGFYLVISCFSLFVDIFWGEQAENRGERICGGKQ